MNILIYIGIILFVASIFMLARVIVRIGRLEVENEKMKTLYQRYFIDHIEFQRIVYTIQYVSHYRHDDTSDLIELFDQKIEELLEKYDFGTPDWNEQGFRAEAYQEDIFNVIISLKIRP